jgi:hypothetical protein
MAGAAVVIGSWPALGQELSAGDLAKARKIYVVKCAKCHRFYEPNDYSEADWQRWITSMSEKSKLKPAQSELLGRFLDAYRAGQLAGKPESKPKAN